MILDAANYFANAVATGNTGERVLGDVIDLGNARDIGAGRQIFLRVQVNTAIAAGAGGTYAVKFVSASNSALSSDVVEHIVTGDFDAASGIAAGTILLNVAIPAEAAAEYGQYIGVKEVVGTANTTAGAIDAFITHDQLSYKAYAQAQVTPA